MTERISFSRPLLALTVLGVIFGTLAGGPARPTPTVSQERSCAEPTRKITLYAAELPRPPAEEDPLPRLGYGFTPETASIPGPTIQMWEGECLAITLVNDIPVETLQELAELYTGVPDPDPAVSLHVHGVKYTPASDGTRHTSSFVRPGEARTFTWFAAPRVTVGGRILQPGSAGYWWYHDHVVGTSHGSGGIRTGLWGALVVRRPGDLLPDRPPFVVFMGDHASVNLRRWPDEDLVFTAREGERVEFVVVGIGDDFHTWHLHGHVWGDTRTGNLLASADDVRIVDVVNVGPSFSFGFQVIAGEGVGAGQWMWHCHVQTHSDQGMAGFLNVLAPDQPELPDPPDLPSMGDLPLHSH